MQEPISVIRSELANPSTAWAVGALGAIAEFTRDSGEVADQGLDRIVTPRGGLCLDENPDARVVSYELPTEGPSGWRQAVEVCLPADQAMLDRRTGVTALGPDRDALRAEDRAGLLFDLGLGIAHVNVCIRSSDRDLCLLLERAEGRDAMADAGLVHALVHAGPHRVFISRLARLEVYQGIPMPGETSPEGPHTHLLPRLLRTGRTHSANAPIPRDWLSCVTLFPATSPGIDGATSTDPHDTSMKSEHWSTRFAVPGSARLRGIVLDLLSQGAPPEALSIAAGSLGRPERMYVRVLLRKCRARGEHSAALDRWTATFDAAASRAIARAR